MMVTYYCHAHGKEFRRPKDLENHIRDGARHGTEGRIECPACKQVFATVLQLKQHSEEQHGMNLAPVGSSVKSTFGAKKKLECPVVGCASTFELQKSHQMLKHLDQRHSGKKQPEAAMVHHVKRQYGMLNAQPLVSTSKLDFERMTGDRDELRGLANMSMDEVFRERREANVQGEILRSIEGEESESGDEDESESEDEDKSDGGVRLDAGCWDELPFSSPWD